jgi:hypothetical protein
MNGVPNFWQMLQAQQGQGPMVPLAPNAYVPSASDPANTPEVDQNEFMPRVGSTPDINQLMADRVLKSIKGQKQNVSDLKDKMQTYAALSAQGGVDLSPLMALSDAWTGSKLSNAYQAPESSQDKYAQLVNMQAKIGQAERGITDDEMKLLATLGDRQSAQERIAAMKENKRPTAEQFKAATFAKRMDLAEDTFTNVNPGLMTSRSAALQKTKFFPSELMNEDVKKVDQAERNFINAILRRESGAAISADEFSNARMQYFPQPGDTEELLAQKKANRDIVRESFRVEGAGAYDSMPTIKPTQAPASHNVKGAEFPSFDDWQKKKKSAVMGVRG